MTERHVKDKVTGDAWKVIAETDDRLWVQPRRRDGSYGLPVTCDVDDFEPYGPDAVDVDVTSLDVRKAVFGDVDFTGGEPVRLRHGLDTDTVVVQVLDADGVQRLSKVDVIDDDTVVVAAPSNVTMARVVVIG